MYQKLVIALSMTLLIPLASPALGAAEPAYPSAEWFEREADNFSMIRQEPEAQLSDPDFMARWQEQSAANIGEYMTRQYVDKTWWWDTRGNACAYWAQQCTGDPYLYPGVDDFYTTEGEVTPVIYFDHEGSLLSGRIWAPRDSEPGDLLPGVVIETGSVQVSETSYWWFAQELVRNGYVVMTYDVRGQGRSDNRDPNNRPGTNVTPDVFASNLVDSIEFFLSTPDAPYQHNATKPAPTAPHNPFWDRIDPERLGIVGHSLGAQGVSVVQGMDPWPRETRPENPVDVAIAWDNLNATGSLAGYSVVPRVPTMGQSADYGLAPSPHTSPPSADARNAGFNRWKTEDVPTYQINVRGGTHFEWSYLPTLPSSSWDDWGNPMLEHYSLAWLDRWLKVEGEPGFEDADARLLEDQTWSDRLSFYYRSARFFPERPDPEFPEADPVWHVCADIKAGCPTN